MTIREAYGIFGLDPSSSTPEIVRATYRREILRNHPDTVHGTSRESSANEVTVRLNLAYEFLANNSFPRLTVTPEPAATTYASKPPPSDEWKAQSVAPDAEFEAWRDSLLRDPRKLFAYHVQEMGVVRATGTWVTVLLQVVIGAAFGCLGLYVVSMSIGLGLFFAAIGFGSAVIAIMKLQGRDV